MTFLKMEWVDPCRLGYLIHHWCTYQIKPIRPNLPNQSNQPNLLNLRIGCMIFQIVDLVKAFNAWVRSAFGLAMFLSTIRKIQGSSKDKKSNGCSGFLDTSLPVVSHLYFTETDGLIQRQHELSSLHHDRIGNKMQSILFVTVACSQGILVSWISFSLFSCQWYLLRNFGYLQS